MRRMAPLPGARAQHGRGGDPSPEQFALPGDPVLSASRIDSSCARLEPRGRQQYDSPPAMCFCFARNAEVSLSRESSTQDDDRRGTRLSSDAGTAAHEARRMVGGLSESEQPSPATVAIRSRIRDFRRAVRSAWQRRSLLEAQAQKTAVNTLTRAAEQPRPSCRAHFLTRSPAT